MQVKWYNKPITYGIMPQTPISCNYPVIPKTVGMFTGSTDKNIVKIFEGDIVKAFLHNETPMIFPITFRSGCFWFSNWNWIEFLDKFRNVEVIGNVYDNPELLKGGTE
ncbi:MAG: YopX family protein [Oscillospiraceae bacterium]